MMTKFYVGQSDYAVPPGFTLAETLEALGMSQKELSIRMGMSQKTINEIIQGKASITPETAVALETVLGVEAVFWLNLESNFRADLARINGKKQIMKEIKASSQYPYSEMAKHNWVPFTRNREEKVINLRKYFGVASLNNVENLPMVSNFRRKEIKQTSAYALMAWLRQGEIQAQDLKIEPFSLTRLKESIPFFRTLTACPVGFASELKVECAKCGVAVSFVPSIRGTAVHGATRWLKPDRALICLSLRYSWSDIFWFSFFHEIGHIIKGHSKKATFINDPELPLDYINITVEDEADEYARETLIPAKQFSDFAAKKNFSKREVELFAGSMGVAPEIVWGRLAKDGLVTWKQISAYRKRLTFSHS